MRNKIEHWKDIEGYEGLYQVSDWGRVKGCDRIVSFGKQKRLVKGVIKNPTLNEGYCYVSLSKNSKKTAKKVHQLVAKAFIPNPDNKKDVDHIDCDKTNNFVENLRWVTCIENMNNPTTKIMLSEAQKRTKHKHNRDELGRFTT